MGALGGVATAVCGASAALATATVVPDYRGKSADVAFTVIAMNALSTLAMLAYPLICIWLGFSPTQTGIMLGATIHDVAQVVGAGQSVSDEAANAAVIVKLFRVFMLLPAVLIVGWWLAARRCRGEARQGEGAGAGLRHRLSRPVPGQQRDGDAAGAGWSLSAAARRPCSKLRAGGCSIAIAALGLGTSHGGDGAARLAPSRARHRARAS